MKFIVLLSLFLISEPIQATPSVKDLLGTWLTLSHQTVTVTHYKEDGTFSGTYFTPSAEVKTTFSGRWHLSKEELTLHYLESSSPVLRVPLEDKNRIHVIDKNTLKFQTLPKGIEVEAKRILFKNRKEVYPD